MSFIPLRAAREVALCCALTLAALALATLTLALSPAASAADAEPASAADAKPAIAFHVAPGGDDGARGDGDAPFATIHRAQQAVRAALADATAPKGPIAVYLHDGTYYLSEPLRLTVEDSGTTDTPVTYQAWGDARPILSGGRAITGWQVGDLGRWRVTLPEVARGEWDFTQLFVNDQRRFRPIAPRAGYHTIAEPGPKPEGARGYDAFHFQEGHIAADYKNLHDVEAVIHHIWSTSRLRIASIDTENRLVRFTGPTCSDSYWMDLSAGRRYRLENVWEAFGEPGDFYLDRPTGTLHYAPRPGESPDTARVIAPRLANLLIVAGDPQTGRPVTNVAFRGLTFAHSAYVTPPEGNSTPQSEANQTAAVALAFAQGIALERCVIRHTGSYAIDMGPGARHNTVEACEMFDLAAGGVKIGQPLQMSACPWVEGWSGDIFAPVNRVGYNTVRDSLIAYGGRMHPAAIGVWIGHSSFNTVEHNAIHDLYYSSVSVGWTWGYQTPSRSHHNIIAHNHMYNIGQRVLSDMGGVYTLGVSPGTEVHGNHIHDVYAFDYGGWGLYTDEGSTDVRMYNNLVHRVKTGSFHQHYGRDNYIENNILAFSEIHQIQRTRTEEHNSFHFLRNIVLWDNDSPLLGSNWRDNNFRNDYNCYWRVGGAEIRFFDQKTLEEWREERGQDKNSIIADPKFRDAANGDFQLADDSPALELGFEPFDYSKAGRLTEGGLIEGLPTPPAGFNN